jgi:hypothetical protein
LEKSRHVRTVFFQILFLLRHPPNIQISKFNIYIFMHYITDTNNPSVEVIYFPGRLWESETWNAHHFISLVKFLPKYQCTRWKWEFGTIWMKKNYSKKLREALPNCRQIHSKLEIWKAIFEHLNR